MQTQHLSAKYRALLAAALIAAAGPALSAACPDVKFKVTNNHAEGRDIEIRRIRFYNPHTRNTQTEDVRNLVCGHGRTCTTHGDNLANALNVDLNSVQVVFAYRERDGDWSDEFQTRPFVPSHRKCTKDGKVYGPIVVSDNAH